MKKQVVKEKWQGNSLLKRRGKIAAIMYTGIPSVSCAHVVCSCDTGSDRKPGGVGSGPGCGVRAGVWNGAESPVHLLARQLPVPSCAVGDI